MKNKKYNLFLTFLFFGIIFIYYLNYPTVSAKGYLITNTINGRLSYEYGIWGYLNENIFKLLNQLFENYTNEVFLIEIMFGLQVALIWSICAYQILKKTNFYSIIILCHPFILNFYCLCTRDAICLGLIFLLLLKGFNKFKLISSFIITFSIHKAALPLIFLSTFFGKLKIESKRFYLFLIFISILISIFIHFLMRYTEFHALVPDFLYSNIFYYPRLAFLQPEKDFYTVGLVNNIYGNINFKLLCFGIIGQLLCINFKNNFPYKTFYLSFSTFFICSLFSSIPNANRFIYHSFLISFPYLFDMVLFNIKNVIKNIE